MEECEKCKQHKPDVFRRAEHGRRVCNGCHHDIMRSACQTGLVQVPRYLMRRAE